MMSSRPAPRGDSQPDEGDYRVVAEPPGGRVLAAAKVAAEVVLWSEVAVRRRTARLRRRQRAVPDLVPPTAVLQRRADWQAAVVHARSRGLPLHRDRPKNWDAIGAVGAILGHVPPSEWPALRVMDAGSARYSPILPWLRLYGLGDAPGVLIGLNIEFGRERVYDGVRFNHGDVTRTRLPSGSLDAITCMSVIEHGLPIPAFLAESVRLLRPGGLLTISTDYDRQPPRTEGLSAYGSPVRIFGPDDIRALVAEADRVGLRLVGELDNEDLTNPERPVHWKRVDLDYTFILLTFERQ